MLVSGEIMMKQNKIDQLFEKVIRKHGYKYEELLEKINQNRV